MNSSTHVIQVTNVSPSTTSEQMRTLFGFLGNIEELKLFPPDDSPLPVTSRVCFVKFHESESVGVSQHLTNTVFVDRALIVVPFAEGGHLQRAPSLLAESGPPGD
uniref:RRM domain-containing protein n=1 Tax=Anabas testudineus TaxID=64144 RepID=A0A7N6BHZ5_ANATE